MGFVEVMLASAALDAVVLITAGLLVVLVRVCFRRFPRAVNGATGLLSIVAGLAALNIITVPLAGFVFSVVAGRVLTPFEAGATILALVACAYFLTVLKYQWRIAYGVIEILFAIASSWYLLRTNLTGNWAANVITVCGTLYLLGRGFSNLYDGLIKDPRWLALSKRIFDDDGAENVEVTTGPTTETAQGGADSTLHVEAGSTAEDVRRSGAATVDATDTEITSSDSTEEASPPVHQLESRDAPSPEPDVPRSPPR